MRLTYRATFNDVLIERDNYGTGCHEAPGMSHLLDDPIVIECDNLNGLLKSIIEKFKVDPENVSTYLEDKGRIDVCFNTKAGKGITCSYKKYRKGFIAGEYDIYSHLMIGTVEVYSAPLAVDLTSLDIEQ